MIASCKAALNFSWAIFFVVRLALLQVGSGFGGRFVFIHVADVAGFGGDVEALLECLEPLEQVKLALRGEFADFDFDAQALRLNRDAGLDFFSPSRRQF